ncbi:JHBP domain-containing protein, partial [Escherichia coli]|nr:JHBP domain-containing protein [Escherichia coli]
EEVWSTGLSNIVINHINYNVLSFALDLDLELPHVHLSAEYAYGEFTLFDNKVSGSGSGSIDVYNVRVKATVNVGVLGGISIRNIDIDFTVGGIDSNINIEIY